MGFELIAYFTNDYKDVRTSCWSQDRALKLKFTQGFEDTRLIEQMPETVLDILATDNVTINFHRCSQLMKLNLLLNVAATTFISGVLLISADFMVNEESYF